MRLKLTLILALLNLIAFGAIYYLESGSEEEPAKRQPRPILSSSITESDRVEIGGEAVPERRVLVRERDSWRLEEPVVWRANPNAVDRIFRALLFLRREIGFSMEDVERNNQSLADYGLETPALELSFRRGDAVTTVRIGAPTEVGNRFYLLGPSGERIFVVDEEVVRSVALDLQDLRSDGLFAMDFFEVREIALRPGNGRNLQIRLAATENGWVFEAPIQTRASAAAVDSRLQRLLETPVVSLQPEDRIPPNESGIVEPRLRVSLEDGGGQTAFLLGDPVPGREGEAYGKLEGTPTIVTVPEAPFLALGDAQTNLRERSFFEFRVPEVSTLRIASPGRTITLQKLENGNWQVGAEGENLDGLVRYPADDGVLARTFESLIGLRAVRFVSDAPSDADLEAFGLEEPQRTVRVTGGETRELLLGDLDPETKTVHAKVAGEPFVYAVPLAIIRELPVSPLAYRDRILDELPDAARITEVRVTDLGSDEILLERTIGEDGASWETGGPGESGPEADAAFAALLQQLRTFRVASYLSASFTDGLRIEEDRVIPWRFALEADILLPGGEDAAEVSRRYLLTERIEGSLQGGGSREEEVTFVLPQPVIDAWAKLLPRRPLPEIYDREAAEEAVRRPNEGGDPPVDGDGGDAEPTPEEGEGPSGGPEETAEKDPGEAASGGPSGGDGAPAAPTEDGAADDQAPPGD